MTMCSKRCGAIILLGILFCCGAARTQPKESVTGIDISLESLDSGYYGRSFRGRGMVYEVIDIADLRPAPNARVRARLGGKWTTAICDARGIFVLDIPVPKNADFDLGEYETPTLELEVSHGDFVRAYTFSVYLNAPYKVVARTDRKEYQPGDTVHFWSRVEDAETGRPLPGVPVVTYLGNGDERKIRSSESGVAAVDYVLSSTQTARKQHISATPEDGTQTKVDFTVGKRSTTDLLVDVEVSPKTVRVGEPVTIAVSVRTVRGTPARGAEVSLRVSDQYFTGTADEKGMTTFSLPAPAYLTSSESFVNISGTARRTGCRAADFSGAFQIHQPSSLEVDLLVPGGGLVPETDEQLIVAVQTENGVPAPKGTKIRLQGPAFNGRVATAIVDRYGFASVPIRLKAGEYAKHMAGDCASRFATTVTVRIDSPTVDANPVTRCVPVLDDALVAPTLKNAAVGQGASFEVAVERRPKAADLPIRLSLWCENGAGLLDAAVAAPSVKTVRLNAPKDRLGLCWVTAQPMLDIRKFPALGTGATEPLLVRPDLPSFPTLTFDSAMYAVKGRARLTVHAPPGVPKSWAAVTARDLAQHQGEAPFDEYFMNGALQQAVMDPSTPEADRLVRASLAAFERMDENYFSDQTNEISGPRMEYDAARLAGPMRNDTVGGWMGALERHLARSLASGAMKEIAVDSGGRRRFRTDALDLALEAEGAEPPLTLGRGKVTVPMITALDPSFTFDNAAARVTRRRLVRLLSILATDLNPAQNDETRPLGRFSEPPERRLSELVRRGVLSSEDLLDPWGNTFVLRRTHRKPRFSFSADSDGVELLSPGPDREIGTADDIRDPWARLIPEGTLYARASGEDLLLARLSAVSPGTQALKNLLSAYDRLTDEAIEELIGDGLSTFGHGGGDGTGSGYGMGSGGLGGRRAGSPSIRSGRATTVGYSLAGILREDFPATLYFKADAPLSPSGQTVFEIPLFHAATTYLVEAILWREDGWRWSASAKMQVDQGLLIDAPVPEVAVVGDEIQLPVRISNGTKTSRIVQISVTGSDGLRISPIERKGIHVPPVDTVEVPVTLRLLQEGTGKLTVAAFDADHRPIDAVRRPIRVKPSKRRAEDGVREVLHGRGDLFLTVPKGATPEGTDALWVTVGAAVFVQGDDLLRRRWLDGMTGIVHPGKGSIPLQTVRSFDEQQSPDTLALYLGAEWANRGVQDSITAKVMEILTDQVEKTESNTAHAVRDLARLLLCLAPAYLHADARPNLQKSLSALIKALRIKVENGAALFAKAPWLHARSAAALLWTAPKKKGGARARELLKHARAAVVTVGEDRRLEGGPEDAAQDDGFVAAALLALAEVREGNDDEAFRLMRSSARLLHFDAEGPAIRKSLEIEDQFTAAAAAAVLGQGLRATELSLMVDGKPYTVPLEFGRGTISLKELGRSGRHHIAVNTSTPEIILVQAQAAYSVDWKVPPLQQGPFLARIEGEAGRADERSGLRLIIRNKIPRSVSTPVVEITLPAGAEFDEQAGKQLEGATGAAPVISADTLILTLRPMRPQESRVIPLPWLWTTAGEMDGLGTISFAADRPEAISVSLPRQITVGNRAPRTGGTP